MSFNYRASIYSGGDYFDQRAFRQSTLFVSIFLILAERQRIGIRVLSQSPETESGCNVQAIGFSMGILFIQDAQTNSGREGTQVPLDLNNL